MLGLVHPWQSILQQSLCDFSYWYAACWIQSCSMTQQYDSISEEKTSLQSINYQIIQPEQNVRTNIRKAEPIKIFLM